MSVYAFTKPTHVKFHGGRWDGLEVEAWNAPEFVIVEEVDGTPQSLMSLHPMDEKQARTCTLPLYERRSSCVPPIHYHARTSRDTAGEAAS